MQAALDQARAALAHGDVPVGAVLVCGQRIVARAHNTRERDRDPLGHAEISALRAGAASLGRWRLNDCDLYVTLEPCPMCAGAMVAARLRSLIFGAWDPKAGAAGSLYNVVDDPRLNHRLAVRRGVRADECSALLESFFAGRR